MDCIDLLVKMSLEKDWERSDMSESPEASFAIPFGSVAFILESYWKDCDFYKKPEKDRRSHPGLSISKNAELRKVAFGSSKTAGRNKSDNSLFFVSANDCRCLKKDVVFLLRYSAPFAIFSIDYSKSGIAPLCHDKLLKLEKRLSR